MKMYPTPSQDEHSKEDDITKLLVGFANDLLAYNDRMTKAGSNTLFIHDYIARRRKRFDAFINRHYIAKETVEAAIGEDETAMRVRPLTLDPRSQHAMYEQMEARDSVRREIRDALNLDTNRSETLGKQLLNLDTKPLKAIMGLPADPDRGSLFGTLGEVLTDAECHALVDLFNAYHSRQLEVIEDKLLAKPSFGLVDGKPVVKWTDVVAILESSEDANDAV